MYLGFVSPLRLETPRAPELAVIDVEVQRSNRMMMPALPACFQRCTRSSRSRSVIPEATRATSRSTGCLGQHLIPQGEPSHDDSREQQPVSGLAHALSVIVVTGLASITGYRATQREGMCAVNESEDRAITTPGAALALVHG